MKLFLTLLIGMAVMISACSLFTPPPCETIVFEGRNMGKVIFDRKKHSDAGIGCSDCHPRIFKKKKDAGKMKPPHKLDRFCGVCHNGEDAPSVHENCMVCHIG
jgi:c(7)-type cytochrome triheme protein